MTLHHSGELTIAVQVELNLLCWFDACGHGWWAVPSPLYSRPVRVPESS